ncbi:MAG: GAF domain-containing sensor histidine kinase, partial [Chloroflexi bacterium]|nr:GAF domain-containing sensor histidine kinase [Chloroflexota bacterium]
DCTGEIAFVIEMRRDVTDQRQLEETLVRRNEQLSAFNALARTVSRSLELEEVLQRALDRVVEMDRMDVAAIFLVSEQLGGLELKALHGLTPDSARLVSRLGLLEGDCGGVVQTGKMVVIPDLRQFNRSRSRALAKDKLRSLVHVPLSAKGQVLGSMCIGNRARRDYSPEDREFLNAVGDQIAVAVENARLYAEVQRKERLRGELLQKVIGAQEEERKRIARELHDETSQVLTALLYEVEGAMEEGNCNDSSRQALERIRSLTTQTLEGLHKLIYDLRPSLLDHLGLVPAVYWLAETRLEPQGIRVTVEEGESLERLPPEMETALFRVMQEAMTNILRHSGARNVHIGLAREDHRLHIVVQDDGIGFDMQEIVHSSDPRRGLGLLGMAERVQLFGGRLEVHSAVGEGSTLSIYVPLPEGRP